MSTTPMITIYVRHSVGCKYESDELAKRCDCRKWLRWSQDGTRHRVKANTRSWAEAEQVKRDLEDQLTGRAVVSPDTPGTKNIRAAIELFITDKKVTGITEDVIGKYERELGRLAAYAERHAAYTVSGITRELLTGYAATWEEHYPSSTTRSVVKSRTRGFLTYCYEAQWIPRIPSLPKITVEEAPTMPLDPDEYKRLLDAADTFKAPPPAEVVHAVVQLMRWSGLAIGDALKLRKERLIHLGNKYRVVTNRQKTGTDVSVVLPSQVGHEVSSVVLKNSPYLFWDGDQDIVKSWTKYVFPALFKAAKIERGGNMMSHRLRDTFACDLLEKGVLLQDVSKALGHKSIKTTERSYGKCMSAGAKIDHVAPRERGFVAV